MKIFHFKKMILILSILLGLTITIRAQSIITVLANADSSRFSPNKKDGWQLYNSYVARYLADSAQLEVIIQKSSIVNWKVEQFIGRIKYLGLVPRQAQILRFNLINDVYQIRIESDGKCFLSFKAGSEPPSTAVIPVKVFYKL